MAAPTPAQIQELKKHAHDTKVADILASNIICTVIAYTAVALRFGSRRIVRIERKADDWLIVVATVGSGRQKPKILSSKMTFPLVLLYGLHNGVCCSHQIRRRKAHNPGDRPQSPRRGRCKDRNTSPNGLSEFILIRIEKFHRRSQ